MVFFTQLFPGISINDEQAKSKNVLVPTKLSKNNAHLKEIYKSMLTTLDSESKVPESMKDLPLKRKDESTRPKQTGELKIARKDTIAEASSKIPSAAAGGSGTVSSKSTFVSHKYLTKRDHSGKHAPSKRKSSAKSKTDSNGKETSELQSNKQNVESYDDVVSFSTPKKSITSKHSSESIVEELLNDCADTVLSGTINSENSFDLRDSSRNSLDKNSRTKSEEYIPEEHMNDSADTIISGTFYSENSLEKDSNRNVCDMNSDTKSEILISRTFNDERALDVQKGSHRSPVSEHLGNKSQNSQSIISNSEDLEEEISEEISKGNVHDRASASGSSASEVISVVENSKGKILYYKIVKYE